MKRKKQIEVPEWYWEAVGVEKPEPEYKFHPARKWAFDFAWPQKMIALEIEGLGSGGYGRHNMVGGFIKDLEKYTWAAILGWRVMRVTTDQTRDGTLTEYLEAIFQTSKYRR